MSFPTSDRIWNLKTKTPVWRRDRDASLDVRWIAHPLQRNLVLCVRHDKTTVYDWSSPGGKQGGRLKASSSEDAAGSAESSVSSLESPCQPGTPRVGRVGLSEDRRYIIVEILPALNLHGASKHAAKRELRLDVMRTETLGTEPGHPICAEPLGSAVSRSVRALLGGIKDQLVFLDHEYWVCTMPLACPAAEAPKKALLPATRLHGSVVTAACDHSGRGRAAVPEKWGGGCCEEWVTAVGFACPRA